jgi:hypothetical protein
MSVEETASEQAKQSAPADSVLHEIDERLDGRALTEELALAWLERRGLSAETIEQISRNAAVMKSREVCVALASHPRTPRHLSLRLIRKLYTFDLMQFALNSAAPAELRRHADEQLIARLASVTLGERLTLARRGSNAVAAALLQDKEKRVFEAALDNGRLTEAALVKALAQASATGRLVEAVCGHAKWSVRREIRIALLRNRHTALQRAKEFARGLPAPLLRDVLHTSRLPEKIKNDLRDELKNRK